MGDFYRCIHCGAKVEDVSDPYEVEVFMSGTTNRTSNHLVCFNCAQAVSSWLQFGEGEKLA